MEAKDRLVKCEDSCPDAGTSQCNDCDYGAAFEEGAKAQDKVSFKAGQEHERGQNYDREVFIYNKGKKAGIKEVVDFVNRIWYGRTPQGDAYFDTDEWQAKLKEWGIKEDR